jgi:hypothetical protein
MPSNGRPLEEEEEEEEEEQKYLKRFGNERSWPNKGTNPAFVCRG